MKYEMIVSFLPLILGSIFILFLETHFDDRTRRFGKLKEQEREDSIVRRTFEGQELFHLNSVLDLTDDNFDTFLENSQMTFVMFYASWSVNCQRLAPTWENLAEELKKRNMPVGVGMVDCMAHAKTCRKESIDTLPTLHWYKSRTATALYRSGRSLDDLLEFVQLESVRSLDDLVNLAKQERDPSLDDWLGFVKQE